MRDVAAVLLGRLSGRKTPLSRLKWSWAAPAASQKAFKASSKSQRILPQTLWRSPEESAQSPFTWCDHPYREGMELLRHALERVETRLIPKGGIYSRRDILADGFLSGLYGNDLTQATREIGLLWKWVRKGEGVESGKWESTGAKEKGWEIKIGWKRGPGGVRPEQEIGGQERRLSPMSEVHKPTGKMELCDNAN